jgi:hypothetical protein
VLSRYLKVIAPIPVVLNSREFPNYCVPFRHRLQAVNVDGESRAFCVGRDEQVAKSREDRDEIAIAKILCQMRRPDYQSVAFEEILDCGSQGRRSHRRYPDIRLIC